MSNNITVVTIRSEPIELYKLLKFEGLVSSGGLAKQIISDGLVSVNGEVETRKRKKLVSGDVIEFDGNKLKLVFKDNKSPEANEK